MFSPKRCVYFPFSIICCTFADGMNPLILHIENALRDVVSADNLRATAFYIAEETTGLTRTELLCGKITENNAMLQIVLEKVRSGEPLQYIFGHAEWLGMRLRVTPATLIPRPETAELVEWVLGSKKQEVRSKNKERRMTVLDCGTGSGCIAIALKKACPTWEVSALDISAEALEIAQENAQQQGVTVHFQQADILKDNLPPCDIIVSNPPYVRASEKASMERNVLEHEPHQALFVTDEDPLIFYRRIAEQHAAPLLYFEINQYLADEMTQMLQGLGYKTELKKDMYGNARMVRGRY